VILYVELEKGRNPTEEFLKKHTRYQLRESREA
jgi:hypothetical protein